MKRSLLVVLLVLTLMSSALMVQAQDSSTPDELCAAAVPAEEPANREFEAAEQVLEAGVDYRAIFCTDAGAVYIDLFEDAAPNTVNNFVFLAQNGFYNNTVFHRVLADFMAQGGDPTGTGGGGPGYRFEDEYPWFIPFDRVGYLAMANAGPATNGSQFFITTAPTPHLNYQFDPQRGLVGHTIFGNVLEGQDVVTNDFLLRDPSDPAQTNSPTTQLQTVLIITDPATVESSFTAPDPADRELIIEKLLELAETAAETPEISITASDHVLTPEEVDAALPEAVQGQLAEYNLEAGASIEVENTACNLQFNFINTAYTLYGFASSDDVRTALTDGFFQSLAEAEGYTQSEEMAMGVPLYTATVQACDTEAQSGRVYVQRGRYVAEMEVTIPVDAQFTLNDALVRLTSNIFEATLTDVLVLELNQ